MARAARVTDRWHDEQVLAHAPASFRGAAAASVRATFAFGSERMRRQVHDEWIEAVTLAGFPHVPADMVVALTDRHFVFGRAGLFGHRVKEWTAALDLDRVHDLAVRRHGFVVGLAIALANGQIVELESLRGRGLHRIERAYRALRTQGT